LIADSGITEINSGNAMTTRIKERILNHTVFELKMLFIVLN
jgi:hypothetical protein